MWRTSGTAAAITAVVLTGTVAFAAPDVLSAPVPANPTQQEALDGLQAAQRYIEQHPDAPLPTSPATTAPATQEPTPEPTPTATATPTADPTVDPVPDTASGLPWSDGVWAMHSAAKATDFATWRGKPVDNVAAFTSRASWSAQLNNWWTASVPASFSKTRDEFIIAVPLWTDDGAAGTDAQWTTLANQIKAVDPDGWVRLGWEMNCCFSKATTSNTTAWRTQFSRAATLLKAQGLRIVFNPNEGVSSSGLLADPRALFVDGKVDAVGIDAYDWYNPYNSDANWANHRDKTYGWNFWYDFAVSKGVPFALPEFGLYTGSSASGGDNAKYINYVYGWLASKESSRPGSIAFVTYFNETAAYCKCAIHPTTVNPAGAAAYRTQINALAD